MSDEKSTYVIGRVEFLALMQFFSVIGIFAYLWGIGVSMAVVGEAVGWYVGLLLFGIIFFELGRRSHELW